MRRYLLIFCTIILFTVSSSTEAQVSILLDGNTADGSAMLEVSDDDRGCRIPSMTRLDREAITGPAEGLMVYNTTLKKLEFFNGLKWRQLFYQFTDEVACGNDMIDARDGRIYSTVQIGDQCWMAENLNVGTPIDTSLRQTNNNQIEKYCMNLDVDLCEEYGGLYEFDEAMKYVFTQGAQGICPDGWHIPDTSEWNILIAVHGGYYEAGSKLKETGTTHWLPAGIYEGTNINYFTALGNGHYDRNDRSFYGLKVNSQIWSSTKLYDYWENYAEKTEIDYNGYSIAMLRQHRANALGIRCIKD